MDEHALKKVLATMIRDAADRTAKRIGKDDEHCKERFLHGMGALLKMDTEYDQDRSNRVFLHTTPTDKELYNLARKQIEAFIFGFTYGHKEIPGEEPENGEVPNPT